MDQVKGDGCKSCQKAFPYTSAYTAAREGLKNAGLHGLSVVPVIAIALKEHSANPWMRYREALCAANLHDWVAETKQTEEDLFKAIGAVGARTGALFPAFRYEPTWLKHVESLSSKWSVTRIEQYLLACSWGVGQKGGWIYCVESESREPVKLLKEFMWSPDRQWAVLAKDIHELLAESDGNLALAATRYNAGRGAHLVTSYGSIVKAIAAGVEQSLVKEGLQLCSDGVKK